jgi:hypothetical protein
MVEIEHALGAGHLRAQMERQHDLIRRSLPRLEPHGPAVRPQHRVAVVVAAHAAEMAEIVVEGTVLLHEDDDMADVLDRAAAAGCRQC